MIPMGKNKMIYMCGPKLTNMKELLDKGIYLGDLAIYDYTRQFVMLNQVRSAEISIRWDFCVHVPGLGYHQ